MAKYKLLRGLHQEGKYPEGHPDAGKPITYHPGDIIETHRNLFRLNSPGAIKFQRIEADAKIVLPKGPAEQLEQKAEEQEAAMAEVPEVSDGLEELDVKALKSYAKEEEIDLGGAMKKDDILATIRGVPVTI